MASVLCKACGLRVPARWPQNGDGTVVLAWRHPDREGQPCEGSGDEHDVGATDVDLTGLVVDEQQLRADEERQRGPIAPTTTGLWVVSRRIIDGVLYQLERVRCGKRIERQNGTVWVCRCMRGGDLHGPYWYSYHTAGKRGGGVESGGRWRRRYVGKRLPK